MLSNKKTTGLLLALLLTLSALAPRLPRVPQSISGLMFVATASATVANTTTETTILGTGSGSKTLEANFWTVSKTVRVRVWGTIGNTGTPTLRIRIKLGATVIIDTTVLTTTAITATGYFEVDSLITCRTTGATGTVFGQGTYFYNTTTTAHARWRATNTTTSTISTLTTQAVDVTAQWGTANAANTITGTNVIIESLN